MKITSLLITAAAALTLVSCETTGSGTTGNSASYSGSKSRTITVWFKGSFTDKEKSAVMRGMNNSLGSKRYGVGFSEYRGGGKPSGKYIQVDWFDAGYSRQIRHGHDVAAFWMRTPFNLMSFSSQHRGDYRSLKYLAEHETDHALGRNHLSADDRRSLEKLRGSLGITSSMDWQPWPSKPVM